MTASLKHSETSPENNPGLFNWRRVGVGAAAGMLILGLTQLDAVDNASACAEQLGPGPNTFTAETFPIPCTRFADDFRVEGTNGPQDDTFLFPARQQFEHQFGVTR